MCYFLFGFRLFSLSCSFWFVCSLFVSLFVLLVNEISGVNLFILIGH